MAGSGETGRGNNQGYGGEEQQAVSSPDEFAAILRHYGREVRDGRIYEVKDKNRYFKFGNLFFYIWPVNCMGNHDATTAAVFVKHRRERKNKFAIIPKNINERSPHGEWKSIPLWTGKEKKPGLLEILKQTTSIKWPWNKMKSEMLDMEKEISEFPTKIECEGYIKDLVKETIKLEKKLTASYK